ncbi:LADA_0E01486g1_1 [Lachancea dasiensis]|uniref:LADA_0E01486g1_1 n=1 Tax=Lachancea dasiensis TaxID=1072105 RepID=A0A1G4JB17_9SACH|nr:LADA_0E01486g1_1 [Lachancea dasiensis]
MLPERHPIFKVNSIQTSSSKRFVCHSEPHLETVVVEGGTIKRCLPHEAEYRFTEFSPLNNYSQVVLNSSGTLLCLHNDAELQILALKQDSDDCKPDEYRIPVPNGIKQVLWHPRARLDSCVVVLTQNDEICTFELLAEDYSQPTAVLNKQSSNRRNDLAISDVAALCFSSDGLTLYLLNTSEGGDLYAFYPFLPSDAALPKKTIQGCFHKALLQYQNLTADDAPEIKRRATRQLQFASQLHTTLKNSEHGSANPNDRITIQVSKAFRNAAIQGPYTINPFPENLYLATAQQLKVLALDDDASDLVLIAFDNGTILQCFPDLEPMMSWEDPECCYNNSLATIGSLNVPGTISLVFGSLFVILTPQKAILVDLSRIVNAINQSLKDCDVAELSEANLREEIVEQKGNFTSSSVWASGTHVMLLSDSSSSSVKTPLLQIKPEKSPGPSKERAEYERSSYDQPLPELIALNDKVQKLMKTPLPIQIDSKLRQTKLDAAANEDQLAVLTDISRELLTRVMVAQTLGLSLHSRLIGQQGELTSHIEKVCEINTKRQEISEALGFEEKRWKAVQAKNETIKTRFESLQKKLMQVSNSDEVRLQPVRRSELFWFKELKGQVSRFNQLVHTQRDLGETLSALKTELEYVKVDQFSGGDSSESNSEVNWEELRALLEKDAKIIGECQTELHKAAGELN